MSDRWIRLSERPLDTARAAMRGAIVHNPEDPTSGAIRFLVHDLGHQPVKRSDAAFGLATPKQPGAMHIQGGQIGPGAFSFVFMLNLHGPSGLRRHGRMQPPPRLNAGFLVGGDDKFIVAQRMVFPMALVEIQNASGFEGKIRVAWKNPTAMLPRANGIFVQPPPECGMAQARDQTALANVTRQFIHAPSRERQIMSGGKFASQGLNLYDQFWGKKTGADPVGNVPPAPPGAP